MLKLVEKADDAITEGDVETPLHALLREWLALSEEEQRNLDGLTSEITSAATAVDRKNSTLIERFGAMARASHLEASKATTVIGQLESVTVSGEKIHMHDITELADGLVNDVIGAVMGLARNAMSMVYSLQDVSKSLAATETSIEGIERINRQTNMLALNARIEAERAGAAGATFKVVADEVKALSNNTESMAVALREQIDSIAASAQNNDPVLHALADINIGKFVMTRNKIRDLNERMHIQATSNAALLGELGSNMQALSTTLDALVEDMQQHEPLHPMLQQAITLLGSLTEQTTDLQRRTKGFLEQDVLDSQTDCTAITERSEA